MKTIKAISVFIIIILCNHLIVDAQETIFNVHKRKAATPVAERVFADGSGNVYKMYGDTLTDEIRNCTTAECVLHLSSVYTVLKCQIYHSSNTN